MAIESPSATNEDFNLSTAESTTVLDLAEMVWKKIKGGRAVPLRLRQAVRLRRAEAVPRSGRRSGMLGFEAPTSLSEALDEVIPWIKGQIEVGGI